MAERALVTVIWTLKLTLTIALQTVLTLINAPFYACELSRSWNEVVSLEFIGRAPAAGEVAGSAVLSEVSPVLDVGRRAHRVLAVADGRQRRQTVAAASARRRARVASSLRRVERHRRTAFAAARTCRSNTSKRQTISYEVQ